MMMKRLAIGMSAMMALLTMSCSNESSPEQPLEAKPHLPVTFSVSQDVFTRLDYINSTRELERFAVVAQVDGKVYRLGVFKQGSGLNYEPQDTDPWIWPDANKEVEFFASNYSEWIKQSNNFLWSDDMKEYTPIQNQSLDFWSYDFEYEDLVCAYVKTKCTDNGVVHLNFEHALAAIGIHVKGVFPRDVNIDSYRVYSVALTGADRRVYHFDNNKWTDYTDADTDESYITYYDNIDGGFVLTPNDTYYKELSVSQEEPEYSYQFIQPGEYTLFVKYDIMIMSDDGMLNPIHKQKSTPVTLVNGQMNIINLTLPYERN